MHVPYGIEVNVVDKSNGKKQKTKRILLVVAISMPKVIQSLGLGVARVISNE